MKKILFLILIISLTLMLSGSFYEDELSLQLETAEESGMNSALSEETKDSLEKIGLDELSPEAFSSVGFADIAGIILENIKNKIKEPFHSLFYVVAASVLCGVIGSFSENFSGAGKVTDAVAALSSSAIMLVPVKNVILSSSAVIKDCSDFMLGFIPVYSSVITASGAVSSAAGFRALMLSTVTAISKIAEGTVFPLVSVYLALCIAGSVSDIDISGISRTVKNLAVWILAASVTVFSGIMGLGTLISSSSDMAFMKTAKFIIGSTVPVVGGTVSDALSSVKGCLEVTKNILGAYAVVVIALIFIPPAISLLIWKISLSLSSGAAGIMNNKTLAGLFSSASDIMGIVLALVVITAVTFIIAVSIMLMTGGGV